MAIPWPERFILYMSFLERYKQGEYKQVYQDIQDLGTDAFNEIHHGDVKAVLEETFTRVAFNLELIYTELKEFGYQFNSNISINSDKPFHTPLQDTEALLDKLRVGVAEFGYVPLSLQYFYQLVGGVNFLWDPESPYQILWPLADPIQIDSLDTVVGTISQDWWKAYINDFYNDPATGAGFIEVAADKFFKDGVEGGPPYAVELTREVSVDGRFLKEEHHTSFINYLRICFENGGFSAIKEKPDSFEYYMSGIKDRLKPI